ncbi:MAG TPA: cytidine deaminase [Flexilinea sp.]|nr:cytidine deaminase [Flexilinea sp.]HOW08079.1 cytidine deaminase [Flexilinea sp.]HPS48634.1 cytidine deaminase [Flexilinea sp.]
MKSENDLRELIDIALAVRGKAYAPYSKYAVGAALRTGSGKIYTGVNVENSSYPLTICAERNAIFHAITEGDSDFEMIVIATENGGSPCGACRQVMAEFALDMNVVMVDKSGKIILQATVDELLPEAFTPKSLRK